MPRNRSPVRRHSSVCRRHKIAALFGRDALVTLRDDLPETIDLLLLDGAKALYGDILDLLESRLRPGSMVVADNADYSPEYLARVRAAEGGYLSVPFGPDVEVSLRLDA